MTLMNQNMTTLKCRFQPHLPVKWLFTLLIPFLVLWVSEIHGADPRVRIDPSVAQTAKSRTPLAGIDISIDKTAEQPDNWHQMAKTLIRVREHEPLDINRLNASVNALVLCRRFIVIEVAVIQKPGGPFLLFKLTPARLIKGIRLSGYYPFFEQDILNLLTIHPGMAFMKEDLVEQKALVENEFKKVGYIDPVVTIQAKTDPADGNYLVNVKILKGPYQRVETIAFKGNTSFGDQTLKRRMNTWRTLILPGSAGRFSENRLKKDVKRLLAYYRKKQYADAKVSYKVDNGSSKGLKIVRIQIDEGPKYMIHFEGNSHFFDFFLRNDLVLFESGNNSDLGIRKTVRKLTRRYQKAGFRDVKITVEEAKETPANGQIRNITFLIHEGPRYLVEKVQIIGNTSLDDKKIQDQILSGSGYFFQKKPFDKNILEEDLYAVQSLYLAHGFLSAETDHKIDVKADDKGRQQVDLSILINQGPETRVSAVDIEGVTPMEAQEVMDLLSLRKGEPFRQYMIKNDENKISEIVAEKGYPHIRVESDPIINDDQTQGEIHYQVAKGPHVKLGETYTSGNFRTKEKILLREIGFGKGDDFSLKALLKAQRSIRDLGIFNSVRFRPIGLQEASDTVDLFIEVEEKKPYYTQISGGYESDQGFYGKALAGDRNLFGLNKNLWVSGQLSQIGHRLEASITEPRLFGSRITSEVGVFKENKEEFNQSFGVNQHGAGIGFRRELTKSVAASLNFRYEEREQYALTVNTQNSDVYEPRTILMTTPKLVYDTRDQFVRPKRGMYSTVTLDISKGLENSFDDFLKYGLDFRYYKTPFEKVTMAGLARAGYIQPYGSRGIVPNDQLFFLGGTRSVRGFAENLLRFDANNEPIGGRTAYVASFETRIEMEKNFELTCFVDVGSMDKTEKNPDQADGEWRTSAGFGLSYITPIGPISLYYGHKLDRKEGEDAGRVHFSIGYTF